MILGRTDPQNAMQFTRGVMYAIGYTPTIGAISLVHKETKIKINGMFNECFQIKNKWNVQRMFSCYVNYRFKA